MIPASPEKLIPVCSRCVNILIGPINADHPCFLHKEQIVGIRADIMQECLKRLLSDLTRTNRLDKWPG